MREADRFTVIRASAGSGKTYQLSGRYLSLLRRGVDPAHILATTFTRKAAGEILGRVLTRLGEAARDADAARALGRALGDAKLDRAAARSMLVMLAQSLHRVGVSTIDAQMHRMAMCHRFELGLPPAPRLIEAQGAVAQQLRRRAIDAMLADETPDVLIPLLRRLQHDAAQRRISDALDELLTGLYSVYRQTDAAAWRAIAPPDPLDTEQVETALAMLREAGGLLPEDKRWHKAWARDVDTATVRDWQTFLSGGLAGKIAAGEQSYYKKPFEQDVLAAYTPLVRHAQAVLINQTLARTEAMHELLRRFDTHYTALRRAHGVVLFDDLPVLLGGVMADAESADLQTLYFRLDTTVGHLLLDEFQDTSPIQWRVLRPFAQEIRATDEGQRTFFCVGDVKQAIYGWRGACAAIFDRVIDDLALPADSLRTMDVSYRSSQAVLDAVNAVFGNLANSPPLAELRTHVEPWAEGFTDHHAHFKDRPGYVEFATTDPADEDEADDDADHTPAGHTHLGGVAQRVAELAAAHPARTIGVLVSRNATASRLLGLLRDRGVAASGEGGSALDEDTAVELMLSALQLADHPGDTAAAFHVRHSPLAQTLSLDRDDPATCASAARRIRRLLLDHGYAEVLTRWAKVLRPTLGPRGVERVTQLIALAERHNPLRPLRTRQFIDFVRSSRVEDPTPARVRVMTVHKAKGLEFDIVVLGELSRVMGTVKGLVWQGGEDPTDPPSVVIAHARSPLRPTLFDYSADIQRAYEREQAARVADDLSAFYVAMTRPRHALYLLVEPLKRNEKGTFSSRGLSNASTASVLRHALGGADPVVESGVMYRHGDPDWDKISEALPAVTPRARRPQPRLRETGQTSRWWRGVRPSDAEAGGTVAVSGLLEPEQRRSRRFGSRVHAALEAIEYVTDPATHDDPAIEAMLSRPAVRQALLPIYPRERLWRERPFALRIGGDLVRGVFDRVAIALDDDDQPTAATLTDFKTDAYRDEAVERYRPQMAQYRAALSRMLGLEKSDASAIVTRLLFVREGVLVEV
ncbi:MAG: UvrD-helicase domain-containing protein [Planctomycetes bacterium]|jgi:ATP-dependent exoDNAse (exonuclease V) beta subunit|nr:UvrD-helicase domain-containing protein [Planctomycetota bacterium]